MIEVIPAILEKDFAQIEKKIHLVERSVSWVQVDIADDTLVPNTTFLDPEPFKKLILDSKGILGTQARDDMSVNFELHMMVKDPLKYLESYAKVGFKRFFAHVEGDFVPEFIEKCNNLGVEAGLAIDGPTDFERIHKYMYDIDCILVMAIEAGFSGRSFREDTVEKIKKIREKDFEIPIAVDGAMIPENVKKVMEAGATRINSNSFIFNAPDVKIAIEQLKAM